MRRAPACAKINLALVVGGLGPSGKHEVTTVLQRVDLFDRMVLEPGDTLTVDGFAGDTLVRRALEQFAAVVGVEARWKVTIEKRVPVAAGLGGASSDAATALRLANATLADPLPAAALHQVAAALGSDVPFFLRDGPQLGERDGAVLSPLDLPQDFWVVLVLPDDVRKVSTASVYDAFDARNGAIGYADRRGRLLDALARVRRPRDLSALPPNDLVRSPLADELRADGAFRADVTGAGPAVYGLFHHRVAAARAARKLASRGRTWVTVPAWYG